MPARSPYRALFPIALFAATLFTAPVSAQDRTDPTLRVAAITVSGNRVTREAIILRELVVRTDDSLPSTVFYERLERSRQNLMNTGLFNTVTLLPLWLDQRHVIVEVRVNERWYLWPSILIDLADPNFNTWWQFRDLGRVNYGVYLTRYNFRGRNETLQVLAQLGYTRQFALRYKVPYLDRKQRWGMSIGGAYLQQAEVTAATVDNLRVLLRDPDGPNRIERYADLEVFLRRRHDVRHTWRFGWTHANVTDTVTAVAIDYFDRDAVVTRFFTVGYGIVWDRRDLRIYPRSGHYLEGRVDRLGIGIGEEASPDVTTVYATAKRWWKLGDPFTLALSLRGRHTFGIPPYYVQEALGYSHQVRGYEYYIVDGEHFALGRANVVYQLVRPRDMRVEAVPIESFRTLHFALYLNAYTDVGRAWDSRYADVNPLANRWLAGYGLGLDLVSSYDQVLRVEYSFNDLGEHGFFLHFSQPF
jgi:outer membrane protein assembly factor BamA